MKKALFLFVFLLIIPLITALTQSYLYVSSTLSITVATDKETYFLRETVNIYGNLTSSGTPLSNGLVAVEVLDPINGPITYRTIKTGEVTTVNTPITVLEVIPCDSTFLNRVDKIEIKPYPTVNWAYFKVRVRNTDTAPRSALITVCLQDGNGILLEVKSVLTLVAPGESESTYFTMVIPYWAYFGQAKAIANAYTDYPREGGIPYCLETTTLFSIFRGEGGGTSGLGAFSYKNQITLISQSDGTYATSFKLPSEPRNGTYKVYVTGRRADTLLLKTQSYTTFNVETASSPPQASFTYLPSRPYVNQSVRFDASASTAEGAFTDSIVRYEWDFGDGTPKVVTTSPVVNYTFRGIQTYIVTLNVTDSEGLWCTTSKPVTTLPPVGPTADFIWYPATPYPNQTVTFDASASKPGWNGTGSPPIILYTWDFGDGNITSVNVPKINHTYTNEGNYTVTLIVTDSSGSQGNLTQTVRVTTAPPLIGDVNGDGRVDGKDVALAIKAFGSYPGHPKWNPNADINNDSKVDGKDIALIIKYYGTHI